MFVLSGFLISLVWLFLLLSSSCLALLSFCSFPFVWLLFLLTSSQASAVAHGNRPLAFYRVTGVFQPVSLEKPMEILEPFLVYVITLKRPADTPNLVNIGSQGAPPHSGEMSRFCAFCSPIFSVFSPRLQVTILDRFARFMAQTTCSVSYTCLFRVWSLQNYFRGLRPKKHQNCSPFSDFADLQRISH